MKIGVIETWIDISELAVYNLANQMVYDGLILAPSLLEDTNKTIEKES